MTKVAQRNRPEAPEVKLRRRSWSEWAVLGTALLLLAALMGSNAWTLRRSLEATELDRLEHQAVIVSDSLVPSLQAVTNALDSVRSEATSLLSRPDGPAHLGERMRLLAEFVPGVRTFVSVDASGRVVASNRQEVVGQDLHEAERYRTIQAHPDPNVLYLSPPFRTPLGNWAVSLGRALVDGNGRFAGYVLAIIAPEFWSRLLASTRYEPDVVAVMIHSGGRIIFRLPDPAGAVGSDLSLHPSSGFSRHMRSGESRSVVERPLTSTGQEALMVFQDIRPGPRLEGGWLVAGFVREKRATLAPWWRQLVEQGALLAAIAVATTAGLFLFQRRRADATRLEWTIAEEQRRGEEERRRAEEERRRAELLRASEERFRGVVENVHEGISILDVASGEYVFLSPSTARLTGFDEAELRDMGTEAIVGRVHPDDRHRVDAQQQGPSRGEHGVRYIEYRWRVKGGEYRWFGDSRSVLRDEQGRPRALVGVTSDITDRKRTEAELVEREARLRSIFDSPMMGIAVTSPEKGWMEVNAAACALLGYSEEELRARTWAELTHPGDLQADVEQFQRITAGEITHYQMDKRFVRKDGAIVWAAMSVGCVRKPDGTPDYFIAVLFDIGLRKLLETALRASEGRFRALAEGAPVGIFETDAEGRNTYINAAGARMLGREPADVLGMGWQTAIHPEDLSRVAAEWSEAVAAGRPFSSRYRVRTADGATLVVHGFGAAVRNGFEAASGFVGVMTDITRHVALEEHVALSDRLAAMGTLVAGLAHEINNPLAVEMTGQGLALEFALGERDRVREERPRDRQEALAEIEETIAALQDAQAAGARVARIVRDMASLARPNASLARTRIRDAVDEALRLLPDGLRARAEVRVEDRGAPEVLATTGQIVQLVTNLVGNAIKATAPGERGMVTVRVATGPAGKAILEVIDRGTGIASEIRGRIFDPFFTTRPVGEGRGTGLGLAICQAIVTAHGGTLRVESDVGIGSTFRVELPPA